MRVGRMVLVPGLVAGWASLACAQEVETFAFTPFYGYRFGGDFEDDETGAEFDIDESPAWGGIFDVRLSEMTQFEFYYSRQETELKSSDGLFDGGSVCDLDIDYYHIGGTYIVTTGTWQPFVVGTLGATHLSPDASDADSFTRFSLGLGGGVRYFPTEHLGLYLAGRALFTFVGSDTTIRFQDGETTVHFASDGLTQAELQAGLIFAF